MKKISLLPLFALVLAIAASAFTNKTTMEEWHLIPGKTTNDIFNAQSYEESTGPESCDGTPVLPCVVEFDPNVYADLQAYLNSFGGNSQALVQAAAAKRTN